MKFIILIFSLFLFSVSSYSQDNTKSNVEFTSDSLEVDENKNLMIAKGNVIIKSEKETIKADNVKYDKTLEIDNLFTLQDEVVSNIIDALVGNGDILSKEVSKVGLTATAQNLDSYACINFTRNQFLQNLSFDYYQKAA